jgi:hypothetical protein
VDTEPLVGPFVRILLHVGAGKLFELGFIKMMDLRFSKNPALKD